MLTGEQTEERFIQKDAIWFSACPIQFLIRQKADRVSKEAVRDHFFFSRIRLIFKQFAFEYDLSRIRIDTLLSISRFMAPVVQYFQLPENKRAAGLMPTARLILHFFFL